MPELDNEKFEALWAKYNPNDLESLELGNTVLIVRDYFKNGEVTTDDAEVIVKIAAAGDRKDLEITKEEMRAALMQFP